MSSFREGLIRYIENEIKLLRKGREDESIKSINEKEIDHISTQDAVFVLKYTGAKGKGINEIVREYTINFYLSNFLSFEEEEETLIKLEDDLFSLIRNRRGSLLVTGINFKYSKREIKKDRIKFEIAFDFNFPIK